MDQPLRARRGLTSITQPESSSASFASTIKQDSYSDNISSTTNQNGNKFTNGAVQEKLSASSRHRAKPSFIESLGGGFNLSKGEGRILAGLILLGSIVRFYRIDRPASVVFDEVHFGGFANKYVLQKFFMDVHPPLAKLLLTFMAWISGFVGGSFDFKDIASDYRPANVPYIQMRMLPATLGLLLIPLAYLTLRGLQARPATALLGAILVMFENGLITQSRFILLDSPLIFFTALTMFSWVGFSNENEVQRDRGGKIGPFSRRWWGWLTLTGLSLGACVSSKWVGLFTIATIGILTIIQLWSLLGDLRVPMPLLARHFVARAICLIVVPFLFYLSMFAIHFAVLNNSGEGDGFMSSEFQHTLRGHGMEDTFADVMLGSHITIRHLHTQGGYLHSHPSNYPGGSGQQQITLYPHRDQNNIWMVLNSTYDADAPDPEQTIPATPILDRSSLVFHHVKTNKKLHSHDVRASVTEVDYQNEVSAYGFDGFTGDANDQFTIEIDQDESDVGDGNESKDRLQALRSKFRLRHELTGCYLFSHKVKLPDWGFEQQEVTCNKNPSKENGLWYVETNEHPALPAESKRVNYRRPGFLRKFAELQAVMWQTNAGLTERHAYDSRPSSWPLLKRGINFWVDDNRQVYLIGNPFVWWTSTLAVVLYAAVRGFLILRSQRGYSDFVNSTVVFYDGLGGFLFLGWFLHYFPFFIMSRQLFLHHYFPALYFAILLSAGIFDLATTRLKPKVRLQLVGVIALITIYTYWNFSPLTYAGSWTKSQCKSAKWVKNWDFSCDTFHDKISMYSHDQSATFPVAGNDLEQPLSSAALAVQPGGAYFKGEERLDPSPSPSSHSDAIDFKSLIDAALPNNPDQIVPPTPPSPSPPILVVEKEKLEVATASFDAGRQAKEVVGAVPAQYIGATKGLEGEEKMAEVVEIQEAPRNLEEKERAMREGEELKKLMEKETRELEAMEEKLVVV